MNDHLPEGWAEVTVAAVASDINYGFTARSSSSAPGPKYLRITDIQHGSVDWASVPHCEVPRERKSAYALLPGDVVFARTGATTGKSYLITSCPDAVFASYLIRVRPSPGVLPEFLYFYFQSHAYWTQISENLSGSAQPNCNASKLSALTIGLPPVYEQRRIVAELNKLLTKVKTSQDRLDRIPTILKRFRQGVLAAACIGKLTVDWRALNPNTERAEALLRNSGEVAAEKKRAGRLWGAGEVPELTEEERGSLPETWVWAKVEQLGFAPSDAVQVGPMSMQSRDFTEEGVPVLNVGCVQSGSFDESKLDHLPAKRAADFSRYRIKANDILFTRSGTVGRCALATERQIDWLMTFHLLRVRPNPAKCIPQYLLFALQGAPHILRQTTGAAIGSTRAGFNTRLLAELNVALPPLSEQREIVRRASQLLSHSDRIEKRYRNALGHAQKLTQSVLAKAFRGELVTTEAALAKAEGREYETAEELLERIKSEPEKARHAPVSRRAVKKVVVRRRA